MKQYFKYTALALALLLALTGCGAPSGSFSGSAAPSSSQSMAEHQNEYTLTKPRMSGRGNSSEDYKLAFFAPESLEGAKGFAVCWSVEEFDAVWNHLSGLSCAEIMALDKPTNRAYIITDLSYCDGVGNTLNTAQKDLVTGEPFGQAGTHYFYAAVFGEDGLLSLTCAPQTVYVPPTAGSLTFTRSGSTVNGSFESSTEGDIAKNYVFISNLGYSAVRAQLEGADPKILADAVEKGAALAFENEEKTDFTLDLSTSPLFSGEKWDGTSCCYVYVASVSDSEFLGLSYCDSRLITPDVLPQSSGTIGDGRGIIFPNGGAAPIGSGRSSILSTSQAIFQHFPDRPRVAILGGASGSEQELWGHVHVDTDSKDSFMTRFGDAGFEAVYIPLTAQNRSTIGRDPYFAALVSSCHGVYFTGGDQSLGMISLLEADGGLNRVGEAVVDLYSRGGFLAGTSAGAHMLGNVCFQDSDSHEALTHPVPTQAELSAKGVLCGPEGALYEGLPCAVDASGRSLVFDSHFGARGRLARLAVMQKASGADFAVGLDEATGLAVSDGVGTVYGSGTVTILDRSGSEYTGKKNHFGVKNLKIFVLSPGDSFDFRTAALTPSKAKSAAAPTLEAEQPEDLLGADSTQTRALLTFALSGAQELTCPLTAGEEDFTATLRKGPDFAAYAGQRKYVPSVLADLPQACASGILLDLT